MGDASSSTCTLSYADASTTPFLVYDSGVLFALEVIAFIAMVGFVAFLFNGFGGFRRR